MLFPSMHKQVARMKSASLMVRTRSNTIIQFTVLFQNMKVFDFWPSNDKTGTFSISQKGASDRLDDL